MAGAMCETCVYYAWDEDWECYVCDADMDMDDTEHLLHSGDKGCPYYRLDDEYAVVRKQALNK